MDLSNETLLSLADAAKFLPKKPNGKRINIRTIERWIRGGNRAGIKLEGLLIGSTLMTTKEALARFGQASLKAEAQVAEAAKPLKSDPRAVAVLESRGILKKPKS